MNTADLSALDPEPCRRFSIGVFGNRQVYAGTTIVRYEQTLFHGIRAAARAYGCNLLLACGVGPNAEPFEWLPAWPIDQPDTSFVPVGPWNTSGLIAIPPFTDAQQSGMRELLARRHPIVFTYPQAGYPSVGPANSAGIAQAFAHLVAHGHRRVVFIAADEHAGGDGAERLAAYRAAAAAHGMPLDRELIGYGGHNAHESYHTMRQMLGAGVDFTAVLTSNDESAIGVLRALADAGLRVPHDVAVIGFDDVLYAKGQSPPLTTIRHPTFELGYRAVELLLDYITGRRREVVTVRVPTRLIVRESCGCQPYSTPIVGARDAARHQAGAPFDRQALIRAMSDAALVETRQSNIARIEEWCDLLVAAFCASLGGDTQPFAAAIDQLLLDAEAANEDPYSWQAAISVLRAQAGALCAACAPTAENDRAENLLDQARVRLSEQLRRQHTRFLVRQAELMDRLGTMTTRLLTALDLPQILEILAEHLPRIGIRHAQIMLFEGENDDRVAWSNLYLRSASGAPMRHPATGQLPVLMYALDPHEGRGALLELEYLLKPLDPEQLAHVLEQQRVWDDQAPGARTILLVDDDPDTPALHARLIGEQLAECRVLQAHNGREALAERKKEIH